MQKIFHILFKGYVMQEMKKKKPTKHQLRSKQTKA